MLSIKGLIQLIFLFFFPPSHPPSLNTALIYTVHRLQCGLSPARTLNTPTLSSHTGSDDRKTHLGFFLFLFFVFCFCFFLLSFSTRSSSSCCLWGGRKKARFCSLYALHTRSITAAIKSRSEHLSAPPERRTQQNACAECVCVFSYPADELHSAGRSALCRRLSVSTLRGRSSALRWDRVGSTRLERSTLPRAFSEISREWGQQSPTAQVLSTHAPVSHSHRGSFHPVSRRQALR